MTLYVISYDKHHDRDEAPVRTLLRGWGAVSILDSVWLISSLEKATSIRNAMHQATHWKTAFS